MSETSENTNSVEIPLLKNSFYENEIDKIGFGFGSVIILIFSCLTWFSVLSGVMIIGLLPDYLLCEFDLDISDITTMVLTNRIGACIGLLFFGLTFDKVSKIYSLSSSSFFVITAMVAICFTYPSSKLFLLCFFLMGFGFGGIDLIDSYSVDFFTPGRSGTVIFIAQLFCDIANIIVPMVAYFTLFSGGWKMWMVILSIVPGIHFFFSLCMPESPKMNLKFGKLKAYEKTMRKLAKFNMKEINFEKPAGDELINSNGIDDIKLSNKNILVICILTIIFFLFGLVYFSSILELNKIQNGCESVVTTDPDNIKEAAGENHKITPDAYSLKCTSLTKSDVNIQVVSGIGPIIGSLVGLCLIKYFSRRKLIIINCLLLTFTQLILMKCMDLWMIITIALIIKVFLSLIFGCILVYTIEYLPYSVRSISLSIVATFHNVGFFSASYFVEYLFLHSRNSMVVGIASAVAVIALLFILLSENKE